MIQKPNMYNTGGVLVKKREEIGAVLREEREKKGGIQLEKWRKSWIFLQQR